MKINKKKIVMPAMRRKVIFIKLKIFRSKRRRRNVLYLVPNKEIKIAYVSL